MKRKTAIILSLALLTGSLCAAPVNAEVQSVITDFAKNELGMVVKNDAGTDGMVSYTVEDEHLKIVTENATSEKLNTGNGFCFFRYVKPEIQSSYGFSASYDFCVTDMNNTADGTVAALMVCTKSPAKWSNGFIHPTVKSGINGGGEFGTAAWECGKWYTVKYYVDLENNTYFATLSQSGAEEVFAASGKYRNEDVSNLNNVLSTEFHPMLLNGTLLVDNIEFRSLERPAAASPLNGAAVSGNSLDVSGTLRKGAKEAYLLLDGNRAATLVANSDSFFTSVDLSNLNFGTHTLGVEEVLISGDTLFSEESVFVLTEISEKKYYEGLPTAKEDHQHNYYFEEGKRFKCNLRLPSSNGWSYVNNSGESLIVKADTMSSYNALYVSPVDNCKTFSNEKIKFTSEFSISQNARLGIECDGIKDGAVTPEIMNPVFVKENGTFADGSKFEAGKKYTLDFEIDASAKTYVIKIDGARIASGGLRPAVSGFDGDILNVFFYFANGSQYVPNGTEYTFYSLKLLAEGESMPYITSVCGRKGDTDMPVALGESISALSDGISVNFSANAELSEDASVMLNGVLLDRSEYSVSESKLMISPLSGFECNTSYIVLINGVTFGGQAVTKPVEARFKTNGDVLDSVGEIIITKTENGASASVTVDKEENSALPSEGVLIVAAYSGNRLTAVTHKTQKIEKGRNILSAELEDLKGGSDVRAFLWNSMSDIAPIK